VKSESDSAVQLTRGGRGSQPCWWIGGHRADSGQQCAHRIGWVKFAAPDSSSHPGNLKEAKSTEKRCHHRRMIGFNYADPEDFTAAFAIAEQKRSHL